MCCRCSSKAKRWWTLGISTLICIIAVILGITWPLAVRSVTEQQLSLQPGSQVFENWYKPPIDTYLELYLWNWTNTEDYQDEGYKPRLEQLGPYTFREQHERVNLSWNDDYTLTFYQRRIWHFDPDLSNGNIETDRVVTINPVLLTVGFNLMDDPLLPWFDQMLVGSSHVIDSPFYNVPVKDVLFEGHDDIFLKSLLEIAAEYPDLIGSMELPPFDRFGWFYGRNESETYDGNFTIGTGVDNLENMGMMRLWNGASRTSFYRDECGVVRGSTGELWPPFQTGKMTNVTVFSPDICSTMSLQYVGYFDLHGVEGYKWIGNERPFDNGHRYEEAACQCTAPEEKCPALLPGVLDVARCKMGAPATVSYPHFYLADQSYRDAVDGMNPNGSEHEFTLALEPHTGVPLAVKAQLQVNLNVKQYGLTLLKGIPEVMLPVLWFRQTAEISEELANDLKLLLILPDIGIYVAIGLGIVGTICFVVALYFSVRIWK